MSKIFDKNANIGCKFLLKYKGVEYTCEAYCWYEEAYGHWYSPYEMDGVRTCQHDYASLIPNEIIGDDEIGCDGNKIEIVDDWFYNKDTGRRLKF
jgi:hypothetical protein